MKHTILIVEDDTLIVNTLRQRFSNFGMQVNTASRPDEAMELLKKTAPELVLLDLMLNEQDGGEDVLSFMRSQPELQHVPVLILTNLEKPELRQRVLGEGAQEYLIKGKIGLDELYNKVLGYLEPENRAKG